MRRGTLALALALAVGVLLPATASAFSGWADQSAMQNESDLFLRTSFILDTPVGGVIQREGFLSQPYLAFYEGEGFDRNFFVWAPSTSVGDDYVDGRSWTGCDAYHQHAGSPWTYCDPSGVKLGGAARLIRDDVHSGSLTGLRWGDTFVSNICGNWSPAGSSLKSGPMPVISGTDYEDSNADGSRESGEPPLAGWTINLYFDGTYVESTTTDSNGAYSFSLNADTFPTIGGGQYTLTEDVPSGWTEQQSPGDVNVPAGAGATSYGGNDFGNWRRATISGHKFDDSNVDGIWGPLEQGIPGWPIVLSGDDQQSLVTDSGGGFSFSVKPGAYSVGEGSEEGWRQTYPGGSGSYSYTVTSGQVVQGADFGNVCLGAIAVQPVDDSTGAPLPGVEVRVDEVSVPGILANAPSLPRTTTGTPMFDDLLPGTYRVTAFLPDGVFTTDPDAVPVDGRFAIVEDVTVSECNSTAVPLHFFTASSSGKVTGGVNIALPIGFATSGFEFMTSGGAPRGTLQFNDHSTGLDLHTDDIRAIAVSGDTAIIWGDVDFAGTSERFRLRLVDNGEPGVADRYELTVANGYEAGQGETISGGNVQIHS